jgi:hypothetical protein
MIAGNNRFSSNAIHRIFEEEIHGFKLFKLPEVPSGERTICPLRFAGSCRAYY